MRLVTVAAFLLVAVAGPALAQSTSASPVTDVGWWTRRPGAAAQPSGGFEVAASLDGPLSVAALRLSTTGAVSQATLVLHEAGGLAQSSATLWACTTAEPWPAANPGAFDDAPKADCDGHVDLEREGDAGPWKGDVGPLLASGASSLMIVPAVNDASGIALYTAFQIQFTKASIEVPDGSSAGSGSSPSTPSAPAADDSGTSGFGGSSPGGDVSGLGATPSFDAGAAPATEPPPADATPPAGASTTAPPAPTSGKPDVGTIRLATGKGGAGGGYAKPWGRLLFLVPLAGLGGLGVAFGRRAARERGIELPGVS